MSGVWIMVGLNLAGKIAAIALGLSAPATALALWIVPDALIAYHVFVFRAQGVVRMHRHFRTSQREVWLTIDDGPDPADTPRILTLLADHGAHATFFVTGQNVAAHPALVRAILAGGHEVAHHTQTHPSATFWCASPRRLARELDNGLVALGAARVRTNRFRPPAGVKNLWLGRALAARGLTCIGWSARGRETWRADVDIVVTRVLHRLAPGAILLLHEGPRIPAAIRVHAIRRVLETLTRLGYRCVVPASEQLAP